MTMQFDVVIIGAGPSGLFSAFQAGMLGMKSAVIDSLEAVGGQCSALYPDPQSHHGSVQESGVSIVVSFSGGVILAKLVRLWL